MVVHRRAVERDGYARCARSAARGSAGAGIALVDLLKAAGRAGSEIGRVRLKGNVAASGADGGCDEAIPVCRRAVYGGGYKGSNPSGCGCWRSDTEGYCIGGRAGIGDGDRDCARLDDQNGRDLRCDIGAVAEAGGQWRAIPLHNGRIGEACSVDEKLEARLAGNSVSSGKWAASTVERAHRLDTNLSRRRQIVGGCVTSSG